MSARREIQVKIAAMEKELSDLKILLEQEKKEVELEYENGGYFAMTTKCQRWASPKKEALKHGRHRDTEEQAEEIIQRELMANRIDALAKKLQQEDIWSLGNNFFIVYDKSEMKFKMKEAKYSQVFGAPMMNRKTAIEVCYFLNNENYPIFEKEF